MKSQMKAMSFFTFPMLSTVCNSNAERTKPKTAIKQMKVTEQCWVMLLSVDELLEI